MGLSLFFLAFLPRAYDLQRFVTADEAKWVYRSAQFLLALERGDLPGTNVNLTPAVTTTWLSGLGLVGYYQFNRGIINLSLTDWLASLPEFRVELGILAATRWPMVLLTSLGVAAIYWVACRLFQPTLAYLAAAFIALDPHTVALSRIIGHDAPTAVFMTLSLLLLLWTVKPAGEWGRRGEEENSSSHRSSAPPPGAPRSAVLCSLSGIAAGLAFLSKAPALFLIPFAGLILVVVETRFFQKGPASLQYGLKRLILWLAIAYLTFVAFWPAAWVDPIGRPLAVFQNAFLSATDQEEADEEGYWRVPDLGPFYYLVNGAFKLSPLVMVGAGLAVVFLATQRPSGSMKNESMIGRERELTVKHNQLVLLPSPRHCVTASPVFWLLVFVVLFTFFMTASDKRSARYILPAFPPLAIIAAWGWLELYQVAGRKVADRKLKRSIFDAPSLLFVILLTVCGAIILLPYSPYYLTYFNPLVGGPFTAPGLVKIGWGEGLDWVGRFLQREGNLRGSRVGTAYASTVAPFFDGSAASVTSSNLDYVVLYRKQVQSGEPSPIFIRYIEQMDSIFSVELNGIHYADVYPGPTLQMLTSNPRPPTPDPQPPTPDPQPIAFRPLTPYGRIGEALEIDVVWQVADPLPTAPATVTLAPVTALDLLKANDQAGSASLHVNHITALAAGDGLLTRVATDLIVSRHRLLLPADLARGPYAVLVNGQPLGEIELRHFQIPEHMGQVRNVIFGSQPTETMTLSDAEKDQRSVVGGQRSSQQIALAAYQFEPTTDYLGVTIAWQAQAPHLPDYTVFVQILDADTNERLAGVDTPPLKGEWPTSRWVKDEVVVDEYLVAIPLGFAPGYYKVIAGLYQPETGQRLTLADGQDHWTLPWTFIRK
ncbi:MAG: phospholipid carrier-dependent glycosyltransferase [Chloroflexi bacterium]|nr:phospholipid carrier-dependent glycosyltransferase [Chloroflexota bacterium]